jgi:hypothetical protein
MATLEKQPGSFFIVTFIYVASLQTADEHGSWRKQAAPEASSSPRKLGSLLINKVEIIQSTRHPELRQ